MAGKDPAFLFELFRRFERGHLVLSSESTIVNTHSLAGLIAMLQAKGLSYDSVGLAEVLWLSHWLPAGTSAVADMAAESTPPEPPTPDVQAPDSVHEDAQLPPPVQPLERQSKGTRKQTRIYPSTSPAKVDTETVPAS